MTVANNYRDVIDKICKAFSDAVSEEEIAVHLTKTLPNELGVEKAALWLYQGGECRDFGFQKSSGVDSQMPNSLDMLDLVADECSSYERLTIYHKGQRVGGVVWKSAVYVVCQGVTEGVLLLGEGEYTDQDMFVISIASAWAGSALSLMRVNRERFALQQRMASILIQKEETAKRLLSADIHDRGITSLAVIMKVFIDRPKEELVQAIQTVINDLREIAGVQLTPFTSKLGLYNALRLYVASCLDRTSVRIVLDLPKNDEAVWLRLDADRRYHVYYVVREAVENALKAMSDKPRGGIVRIELSVNHEYRVKVVDNGPGFDTTVIAKSRVGCLKEEHFGLAVMHARMMAIGGSVEIQSVIGKGTSVEFRFEKSLNQK